MEKSYFLSMTFNNIVFQGRNKAYGAYSLRRAYSKHMLLAGTIATAVFSGALVGPLVETVFFDEPVKYVKPTYTIVEPYIIKLPEPPKPEPAQATTPPPAPEEKAKVKTEKFTTPNIVSDAAPEKETVPDNNKLSEVKIGTESLEGETPEIPSVTLSDAPPVGIEGGTAAETPAPPAAYIHVEQMPQFRGGIEALSNYLSRKLRYPTSAQTNNIEGTVVVTFVIGTNGEITNVEVLKGLGFGTEEEAARVVASMPRWEPGRQNGRAVPVRYTLPIRFRMQ